MTANETTVLMFLRKGPDFKLKSSPFFPKASLNLARGVFYFNVFQSSQKCCQKMKNLRKNRRGRANYKNLF